MSRSAPFQFGLSSMLLITTLVAVIMSVSVMVPGIGIALAIVSLPALVRTYVLLRRQRRQGKPVGNYYKAGMFVLCLGITLLIALAAYTVFMVTFFAVCFVGAKIGGPGSINTWGTISVVAGAAAAIALLIYLLWIWFRHPRVKPDEKSGPAQNIQARLDQPPTEPHGEAKKALRPIWIVGAVIVAGAIVLVIAVFILRSSQVRMGSPPALGSGRPSGSRTSAAAPAKPSAFKVGKQPGL